MSIVRSAMMTTLVVLPCLVSSAAEAAQQWTMKGKLEVEHLLPELVAMHGATSALSSAQVHLWARSKSTQGCQCAQQQNQSERTSAEKSCQ